MELEDKENGDVIEGGSCRVHGSFLIGKGRRTLILKSLDNR